MDDRRTYYQILGLERAATLDQIRTARARMLRLYHPDLHPKASESEKEEFTRLAKIVNKAYSVLSDSLERAAYDEQLDKQASAANNDGEPHSETSERSRSSNSSYRDRNTEYNDGVRGSGESYGYSDYAKPYRSTEEQLYADARGYVTGERDCTKRGLKEYLHDRPLTSRELDRLVVSFLDRMCDEDILEKTTGGATRYHFKEPYDDDDGDDNVYYSDASVNEYEEAPAENRQPETHRRPPKNRSGRWLGIVFWLIVAGWALHHFVSRPPTQAPDAPAASGVPLSSGQITEPRSAQGASRPSVSQYSVPDSLGVGPTESASAAASEAPSVPLPNVESTVPWHGLAANASTPGASAQQDISSDEASSADWHIVHEVPPTYPIAALRLGESGTTVVEVKLDADGKIIAAQVRKSSGYHDLDRAAVRAVRKFEFAPPGGDAAKSGGTVLVPVAFRQQ